MQRILNVSRNPRHPDCDLKRAFSHHGIRSIIAAGMQVQTAIVLTAAEAVLRRSKVIVPVDGMSSESLYLEQYTTWHLAKTLRVL